MSKGEVDVICIIGQVARVTRYKSFFTKCSTKETKIILKAYFTQKVGSVGNFECGNQVYSRRQMQTYEPWYIQERSRLPYILTRKCFTIAIKTIQLSSHITHDEFIKATIFQRNAF